MCSAEENCAYVRRLLWERDFRFALELEILVQCAILEVTDLAWPEALAV